MLAKLYIVEVKLCGSMRESQGVGRASESQASSCGEKKRQDLGGHDPLGPFLEKKEKEIKKFPARVASRCVLLDKTSEETSVPLVFHCRNFVTAIIFLTLPLNPPSQEWSLAHIALS